MNEDVEVVKMKNRLGFKNQNLTKSGQKWREQLGL
jgi:hypothetical protein